MHETHHTHKHGHTSLRGKRSARRLKVRAYLLLRSQALKMIIHQYCVFTAKLSPIILSGRTRNND